jgi:hypothetical protein
MGRQTGLIKVSGNIGGVSFYKSNGQDLARVANGPSKEKIQNDSNFVRTRENNSEFGGSANIAKALRLTFATSIQTMADNRLVSRLTALFKDICNKDMGVRGQRSISLSAHMDSVKDLEFNIKNSFGSVFNVPYTLTHDPSRTKATLTATAFDPRTFIKAPAGATSFRVVMAMGVISDYTYNVSTGKYEATDPAFDKLTKADAGIITPMDSTVPATLNIVTQLTGSPILTPTTSVLVCIGIQFFQQIGATSYLLAQGNCMKVVDAF